MTDQIKVNLGCQIHHFDGWINQDIVTDDPAYITEWKCDANKLPTADNTVDFMYAGHLVEHFYPDTIDSYIKEWHRVLKPGGRILIITPDFGQMAKLYAEGAITIKDLLQPAYGRIYHYDRREETHHILYDDAELLDRMGVVPWTNWGKVDLNNPPPEVVPFMDHHISRSTTQLAYLFTK